MSVSRGRTLAPAGRTRSGENIIEAMLLGAASVSVLAVAAIFAFLLYFSAPLILGGHLGELLTWRWRPFHGEFGILPMVAGSLMLALSAMLLAFPAGIGICCFAHGLGPKRFGRVVMATVRFMTSIPTVVYGFVAIFLLVPLIRSSFGSGSGFSWLAAALTLSLLVLPTIVLLVDAQLRVVEPRIRLTTAALGMSPAQSMVHVLLPLSRRGIMTAAVLGFGRSIGDTLVPLMLAGNAPHVPGSLLEPLRTLTAHIALVVATDSQSPAYNSLFAAGLILLLSATAVNLGLRYVRSGKAEATA
jgi:phosphate transport system permease protein